MGVPYQSIMVATALRINGLRGADQEQMEATYTKDFADISIDDFTSSIFPKTAIRDAILNAEQKLAEAIGKSADRALRARIGSETEPLANGDALPAFDLNGLSIVGNFGAVWDETTPTLLFTRKPVPFVRRRLARTDLILPVYYYALDSGYVIHTGPGNIVIECCTWDWVSQVDAFDANDDMLLADHLAEAIICGAVAMLVRDDEFMDQAGRYATYFTNTLAAIPPAVMEEQAV